MITPGSRPSLPVHAFFRAVRHDAPSTGLAFVTLELPPVARDADEYSAVPFLWSALCLPRTAARIQRKCRKISCWLVWFHDRRPDCSCSGSRFDLGLVNCSFQKLEWYRHHPRVVATHMPSFSRTAIRSFLLSSRFSRSSAMPGSCRTNRTMCFPSTNACGLCHEQPQASQA